jgi:hypothetical protein
MTPEETAYDRLLKPESPSQIEEALAYREAFENPEPEEPGFAPERPLPPWQDVVSPAAYSFIVKWETGGRPYYEQVIKGRPIWPQYSSGITIGCGYDLGYHTVAEVSGDWSGRIAASSLNRLMAAVGFKTVDPGRQSKVIRAKELVQLLSDITIPWEVAVVQFDDSKMPTLIGQLERALPNLEKLHPHCYGALLSLVFNRGAPFRNPGPRYVEMVEIAKMMKTGTPEAFAKIPDQLRSMARIWGADSGLGQRRKGEADLFALGLREVELTSGPR